MSWLLFVLFIILIIFCYLAFAPFYLEINSIDNIYRVRFHRLATAGLVIANGSLKIDLKILGWSKRTDVFKEGKQKIKPAPAQKEKKQLNISLNMVLAIIRSFRVNKCYLTIDTGNMSLNGILYPAFYLLNNRTGKTFEVNFLNKNEIILEIENNLASIIKVIIFHLFIIKKQKTWTT